jgi:hypothetical protein
VTADTVAVNGALVAPEATVTEAGTPIALLLLLRLTASPVLGAAAVNLTVQLSVPGPLIEVVEQLKLERDAVPEFEPFPWSLIVVEDFVELLVVPIVLKLRVAVESVVVFGLYCTFTLRL